MKLIANEQCTWDAEDPSILTVETVVRPNSRVSAVRKHSLIASTLHVVQMAGHNALTKESTSKR